jgi:hypothetical protein
MICAFGDERVGGERRFNRATEIDTNHLACAPTRRELRVTSLTATGFEDDLVAERTLA